MNRVALVVSFGFVAVSCASPNPSRTSRSPAAPAAPAATLDATASQPVPDAVRCG
jgi:hypothetical protein